MPALRISFTISLSSLFAISSNISFWISCVVKFVFLCKNSFISGMSIHLKLLSALKLPSLSLCPQIGVLVSLNISEMQILTLDYGLLAFRFIQIQLWYIASLLFSSTVVSDSFSMQVTFYSWFKFVIRFLPVFKISMNESNLNPGTVWK